MWQVGRGAAMTYIREEEEVSVNKPMCEGWLVIVSWRRTKWTWLIEFAELNAVYSIVSEQFIVKWLNQK